MRWFGLHLEWAGLWTAVVCLWAGSPAFGLVLHGGDQDPPADRPPDGVMGRWSSNASCVAVSPNYVLTTQHQGGGTGTTVVIGGTTTTVTEIFAHALGDIRLARLASANLADYVGVYAGPEQGVAAVLGGFGKGRGANLQTGGVTYGYAWAGADNATLRWGANRIDSVDPIGQLLRADFDALDAPGDPLNTRNHVAREAGVAEWDSGGGWFIKSGGVWKVAGLTHGVEHFGETWFRDKSAPSYLHADVFDAVRVSYYAGWMDGVLNPIGWNASAGGNWSAASNWSTGAAPNAADRWAVFGAVLTGDRTITLDQNVRVGTLRFDNSHNLTLAATGGCQLTFDGTSGTTGIEVNRTGTSGGNGAHTISAPLVLGAPLYLNQNSSGLFALLGVISGSSAGITKLGSGTAALGAANTFTGDVEVREGTLRVTNPAGLGKGGVRLTGGTLDLRSDTAATFANGVTVKGPATLSVNPAGGGSGRTLTIGSLAFEGDRALTVAGSGGYALAVSGPTTVNMAFNGATINTASADVTLFGGLTVASCVLNKAGNRTLTLSGPQNYWANSTLNVTGGTVRMNADAGGASASNNLAVNVTAAGAAVTFGASQHLAALNVNAGAARIDAGGNKILVTRSLSLGGTGAQLDMADNFLVVDYTGGASPLLSIEAWIRAGYHGGQWDGNGMVSSEAVNRDPYLWGLGYADNDTLDFPFGAGSAFGGMMPNSSSILVRFTILGDVNLDGVVDINDISQVHNNYGKSGQTWAEGDVYGYDGVIDINDIITVHGNYGRSVDELLKGLGLQSVNGWLAADLVTVPEPATLALAAVGGLLALARRRRLAQIARVS